MKTKPEFQRINTTESHNIMARGNVLVLDMRDKASFDLAHIEAAQHVSSTDVDAIIFSTQKNLPILIYCYHGDASQVYAQMFVDFGFCEVYSLDGGFEAWHKSQPNNLDDPLQRWLVMQGFAPDDIHATAEHGLTPLMKASRLGDVGIVTALVRSGTRLDTRNTDGNNVLWLACVGANLEVIDFLIQSGVDIDNQNDSGATCLMYAASTGKAEVVQALLAAGANTQCKTFDDFTALDMASTLACLNLLRKPRVHAQCAA